jgi:hypothetical protein
MENKVVVVAKDGAAKVEILNGYSYRVLEDHTCSTFKTSSLESFVSYCEKFVGNGGYSLFYCDCSVSLLEDVGSRYHVPVAECIIEITEQLHLVEDLFNSRSFSLSQIESQFINLRKYIDSRSMQILAMARSLSLQKVTEVNRQKDDRGNYVYMVSSKIGGKEVADYPTEVSITVPILKMCSSVAMFSAEPTFEFSENNGNITISFSFRSVGIEELITNAIREAIESECSDLGFKMFYGAMNKVVQDNSWEFQSTGK